MTDQPESEWGDTPGAAQVPRRLEDERDEPAGPDQEPDQPMARDQTDEPDGLAEAEPIV